MTAWRRAWSNAQLVAGTAIVTALVLATTIGTYFGLASPYDIDVGAMLLGPDAAHLLGTDELGRDLLSRTVYAARISLLVAMIAGSIGLVFGVAIGIVSAYLGGWIDIVLMRAMELLFSFPAMLLAIIIMASAGTDVFNATIAIGIVFIPAFSRLARASTQIVLRQNYIDFARGVGMSPSRIMLRQILPNIAPLLYAETAVAFSQAIVLESALSFLGLGAQPPEPAWGTMLNVGRGFIEEAPWMSLAPGGAIFLTVLGFHLIADGLRDLGDPRHA